VSIGSGSGVIDRAWTDALVKQILSECTINRDFNVPLGAGSSQDGQTIYIDKSIPNSYKQKGGAVVPSDHYVAVHEYVEKRLLDAGIKYLPAHASATATELAAVQDDGFDVNQYDTFFDKWLKVAAKHKLGDDTPPDLELKPYEES
jgi:hypothetical protein